MRASPALLLAILSACAGAGGATSSSSSSSASSSSGGAGWSSGVGGFYREYYLAYCDVIERCAEPNGREYSTRQACADVVDDPVLLAFFARYDALYTVDSLRGPQCISAIESLACTDLTQPTSCIRAVIPRAPVPIGSSCERELCGADAYCDTCSVCRAQKANGIACSSGTECQSNTCGYGSEGSTCEAAPEMDNRPGRGEPCLAGCAGALQCTGEPGAKTCNDRVGVGQACSTDPLGRFPLCFADLVCSPATGESHDGTCVARLADGAQCARSSALSACAHYCRFPSKDAAQGTCVRITNPSELPGPGEPCIGSGICRFTDDVVARSLHPAAGPSSCECVTTSALGGACFADNECAEGYCRGGNTTPPSMGTCSPRLGNGQQCVSYSECESGSCDFAQAPAVCGPAMCM